MQWSDYFYSETYNGSSRQGTLKNKLDIKDEKLLDHMEFQFLHARTAKNIEFSFNTEGLKAVHHHLFQDLYDWAGEFRQVNMGKGTDDFTPFPIIQKELDFIFHGLNEKNNLIGLSQDAFIKEIATFFNAVNIVHPFREGNGRTQRYFFEHVAQDAGYKLDFQNITKERMIDASIAGSIGDLAPMTHLFLDAIDPQRIELLKNFIGALKQHAPNWNEQHVSSMLEGRSYTGSFVGATTGKDFTMQLSNGDIVVGDYKHLQNLGKVPKKGENFTVSIPTNESMKQSKAIKI